MIEMITQAAPTAGQWLGLDWKVMGIVIGLLTTIMGSMLGLVYKLIVSNFAARVDLFDQKVDAVAERFAASVDKNSALDIERLDRLRGDVKTETQKREKLEADFRNLLERLPIDYVHRKDWVRGFNQLDGKVDRFAQKTDARLEAIYELVSNTRETVASKGK